VGVLGSFILILDFSVGCNALVFILMCLAKHIEEYQEARGIINHKD
jgi:hypothetical protein